MNNLTNTNQNTDGAQLWARLDAVSIGSDLFEFLELVRDLAGAPEEARRDVAARCAGELSELDAQIATDSARRSTGTN